MNDGNNDEFSATRGGGGGEDARRGSACTVCTYMYIYVLCVSEWVSARVTEVDGEITERERKKQARIKKEENERAQGQNRVTT